jgi:hypothetical protein
LGLHATGGQIAGVCGRAVAGWNFYANRRIIPLPLKEDNAMTRGLIFWVLMLIWFVFALVINFGGPMMGGYAHGGEIANTFLFFILFVLLGWQVYGPPVHG